MDSGIGSLPLSTLRSAPFISFPMMHVMGINGKNHYRPTYFSLFRLRAYF